MNSVEVDGKSGSRQVSSVAGGEIPALDFPLHPDGYIDHWLVAGPQHLPVLDLGKYDSDHPRPGILQDYHNCDLLVSDEPIEGGSLIIEDFHGFATFPWEVRQCEADHFVDFSNFGANCHYSRSWAFANIVTCVTKRHSFEVAANGPFDVWINGKHVHRHVGFHYQIPLRVEFLADLAEGENQVIVVFEVIAIRECPYAVALKIRNPDGCHVRLRTSFPLEERNALNRVLRTAAMDRSLFHAADRLQVCWPSDLNISFGLILRLQSENGKLHTECAIRVRPGAIADLGEARKFPDGRYRLILATGSCEPAIPISRCIPLRIANGSYSTTCYGTYEERVQEALIDASGHLQLFSEIAKMELDRWDSLQREPWNEPLARLRQRGDCSDFSLVGMLGALSRHGHHPSFPKALREEIAGVALNFRYWLDEPGNDAMCFHTENHQILFHTCEVLAGQLFPEHIFPNAGQTGLWHKAKGERLATAWLRKKGAEGFQEWDSNVYFDLDVVALTHLADLAENTEVAFLAMMLLDKLFATIALNSFRGVFGSTHGRVYSENIKGGRLELTSGLTRMLWGMGVFGDSILGVVSLAAATKYRLPDAVYEIATGSPGEAWSRERHGGRFDPACDLREGNWEVNKVTYKTDDYMLCSAQDLAPGQPGNQQHIWQATFGPDAVVFTTHPVCIGEDSYHRPNFWHGNGNLPRVAQWKDFLIALYSLPAGDCMGFTHAYFPTIHFDEWSIGDRWAFARKDNGYIALRAWGGLELSTSTIGAREELRSHGRQNIWLCQMGRQAQDGSFADFQRSIMEMDVEGNELSVQLRTLRGDELRFAWTGPFFVNSRETPIKGFAHYEGPFGESVAGSGRMTLRSRSHFLRLDFNTGQRETVESR